MYFSGSTSILDEAQLLKKYLLLAFQFDIALIMFTD